MRKQLLPLSFSLAKLTSLAPLADFESVSQVGANSGAIISGDERSRIREYVEEIVAEIIGGNLDTIRVGQLSRSENCKYAISVYSYINIYRSLCARSVQI